MQLGDSLVALHTGLQHRGAIGQDGGQLFALGGTYEAIGGGEAIGRLVDRLYDRLEADPVLRPAFGRDLANERAKVKRFFEAWFGGSQAYFDTDWPPGLQVAHAGISISRGMAARWLTHFFDSFAEMIGDSAIAAQIEPILTRLAMSLVNRDHEPVAGEGLRCSAVGVDPRLLRAVQRDDEGLAADPVAHPGGIRHWGPRLLLIAAVRGKVRSAEALLRQGVGVNAVSMLSGTEASAVGLPMLRMTALCGALAMRREPVVDLLVRHGARYDIFTAAFLGDLDGIRQLLDLSPALADAVDPAYDVAGFTPLMHAVSAGQLEAARLLLHSGATVGPNSVRMVRAAANGGYSELTDLLLEHGADPASIGAGPWALYPQIAEPLLAAGASVNDPRGRSWIGMCCTGNSGHRENAPLARALLRCGADVRARYRGATALHCASKAGFAQVVEALIEYGADVNALDDRGQTPLDACDQAGRSIDTVPVQRLLLSHGARRSGDQPKQARPSMARTESAAAETTSRR